MGYPGKLAHYAPLRSLDSRTEHVRERADRRTPRMLHAGIHANYIPARSEIATLALNVDQPGRAADRVAPAIIADTAAQPAAAAGLRWLG